ncbi:MAG: S8 family peptidase [Bacteroidia bacterium]|nr:S8 family peptidase [Bacteroidia bacterium]
MLNRTINYFSVVFCILLAGAVSAQDRMLGGNEILPNTIIVKCRVANNISAPAFVALFQSMGGYGLHRKFPSAKTPRAVTDLNGNKLVDLTLVYEFSYSGQLKIEKAISKCSALNLFEYVEPHYIPKACYLPNDTSSLFQYHISQIKADSAWSINSGPARGDTNMVIGITDTGIELTHPDLYPNIKLNYADTLGGGDDDGDGYVDNFAGWDLGENDNNPNYTSNAHGVHVAGIAAAKTDNITGVAGVGFNCKFLPVKIANASGSLTMAYEGIAYAAEHGCKVINCSWGSAAGGQLGQDVINYATFNFDALVVAAAGNNSTEMDFYPASFQHVLSVANTDWNDVKASTSNYGYNVDVCAPGESIYSTYPSNSYSYSSGTSMASPVVAGAAAIVRSSYPSLNALQTAEQLKTTADDIYPLNLIAYENKLGAGRVNLYRALTANSSPSIVMTQRVINDQNDNNYYSGDTLRISGVYTNYLAAVTNLQIDLLSASPYVTILDGNTPIGAIATLGSANNNADVFEIELLPGIPNNYPLVFEIKYTDGPSNYLHSEFFTVMLNPDYINIDINDVATTITSIGRIGYRTNQQTQGLGFTYNGSGSLFYEAGLMVGINTSQVSDGIRNSGTADNDFASLNIVQQLVPAVNSDFDVHGRMNDAAAQSPLFIDVRHKAFAWTSPGNRKYVMLEYDIKNTGITTLNNLYAGLFSDWDIDASSFNNNRASADIPNKMGFVYNTTSNLPYAGVKVLSNTAPALCYSIDNVSGGNGGIDMYNGFDTSDKYITLSTNRVNAGVAGNGADVAQVVSTGPFTILPGDSVHVAFAIVAGDSLPDLQSSAVNAQAQYDAMHVVTALADSVSSPEIYCYPNPTNALSTIKIVAANATISKIELYSVLGQKVFEKQVNIFKGNNEIQVNVSSLSPGLYHFQVFIGDQVQTVKMIVTEEQ